MVVLYLGGEVKTIFCFVYTLKHSVITLRYFHNKNTNYVLLLPFKKITWKDISQRYDQKKIYFEVGYQFADPIVILQW